MLHVGTCAKRGPGKIKGCFIVCLNRLCSWGRKEREIRGDNEWVNKGGTELENVKREGWKEAHRKRKKEGKRG